MQHHIHAALTASALLFLPVSQAETPAFRGQPGSEFSGWESFVSAYNGANLPDHPSTTSDDAVLVQILATGAFVDLQGNIDTSGEFSAYSLTDSVPGDLQEVVLQVATDGSPRNLSSFVLLYQGPGGTSGVAPASITTLLAAGSRRELSVRWQLESVPDEILAYELFFVSSSLGMVLDAVLLDVRYTEPLAGEFCPGDGTGASCPCGNSGAPGHGCDIAQGTGGVRAEVVALDRVVGSARIVATGFPPAATPSAIVIRGNNEEPVPVSFGDGLRCVGTTGFARLAATNASGGSSTHDFSHGAGPGTFRYQVWFRNTPLSYCVTTGPSGGSFNLSNGQAITW